MNAFHPSVGTLAAPLVDALVADADRLRLGLSQDAGGARIVDAGIETPGGIEAGRRIAEICLGGLGWVALQASERFRLWPTAVTVTSSNPVIACLGSQYAGWSLSHGDFFALGSGPGRALIRKEALFEDLGYGDRAGSACFVLEVDRHPPPALVAQIAEDCCLAPDHLTLILTPTRSLAGTVQIVARVLEVALHKAHALRFPIDRIIDGIGVAPLPPPAGDFLTAIGRTNDATLYGGDVHLFVAGPDDDARMLAQDLPSSASRDHGRAFRDIFAAYKGDFYAIDPMLFSPARITVTAIESGRSFSAGRLDEALVDASFGSDNG